jgi:hypothetical protein
MLIDATQLSEPRRKGVNALQGILVGCNVEVVSEKRVLGAMEGLPPRFDRESRDK